MNDKWTKVNRVAVIVSFCVCVVGLLIVFVASLMDGYNMYWLFALSGIVSAVISHIMWAMYIEMSENIIHIASRNTRETDRTLSDISQTLGKILANMSNGGAVRPDTGYTDIGNIVCSGSAAVLAEVGVRSVDLSAGAFPGSIRSDSSPV